MLVQSGPSSSNKNRLWNNYRSAVVGAQGMAHTERILPFILSAMFSPTGEPLLQIARFAP